MMWLKKCWVRVGEELVSGEVGGLYLCEGGVDMSSEEISAEYGGEGSTGGTYDR